MERYTYEQKKILQKDNHGLYKRYLDAMNYLYTYNDKVFVMAVAPPPGASASLIDPNRTSPTLSLIPILDRFGDLKLTNGASYTHFDAITSTHNYTAPQFIIRGIPNDLLPERFITSPHYYATQSPSSDDHGLFLYTSTSEKLIYTYPIIYGEYGLNKPTHNPTGTGYVLKNGNAQNGYTTSKIMLLGPSAATNFQGFTANNLAWRMLACDGDKVWIGYSSSPSSEFTWTLLFNKTRIDDPLRVSTYSSRGGSTGTTNVNFSVISTGYLGPPI